MPTVCPCDICSCDLCWVLFLPVCPVDGSMYLWPTAEFTFYQSVLLTAVPESSCRVCFLSARPGNSCIYIYLTVSSACYLCALVTTVLVSYCRVLFLPVCPVDGCICDLFQISLSNSVTCWQLFPRPATKFTFNVCPTVESTFYLVCPGHGCTAPVTYCTEESTFYQCVLVTAVPVPYCRNHLMSWSHHADQSAFPPSPPTPPPRPHYTGLEHI
jgi:hypothetical protein